MRSNKLRMKIRPDPWTAQPLDNLEEKVVPFYTYDWVIYVTSTTLVYTELYIFSLTSLLVTV